MSIKHLFKAVATITVFSIITRALGFIFRIYLSRELGPEMLGLYQMALSVFGVLLCAVSSGLPLSISKFTSYNIETKQQNKTHGLVSAALIVGLVLSLVCILVSFVFKPIFLSFFKSDLAHQILLSLLPAVLFSSIYATLRGELWGKKRFFDVCITELFEQVTRMILCVVFISASFLGLNKVLSASISLSIACIASAVYALILYLKHGGKFKSPKGYFKPVLKSSSPVTGLRIASSLATPLISFILPLRLVASGMTHADAIACLGIVMGMTLPLLFLPSTLTGSLAMALVPDISATHKQKPKETADKVNSALSFTLVVSLLFIPLFFSVGPAIGEILFHNRQSGILLSQSCIIMVPMGISGITSSILNSLNLEVKSFKHYIFGSIFMLAIVWFLPAYIQVLALPVGMGVLSAITSVLNIRMIEKALKHKLSVYKPCFTLLLLATMSALLGRFLFGISGTTNLLVSTVVSGGLASISFIVLLQTFNFINIKKISKKIFTKSLLKKQLNVNILF